MKYVPFQPLETPRLRLRALRETDTAAYHTALFADERLARGMLWTAHTDPAVSTARLQRLLAQYGQPGFYHWGIALPDTDELIGIIALSHPDPEHDRCSFVYMLAHAHWGNGYAAEALSAVLAFAFEALALDEITADHFADNPASGRAMQKAGMQRCGVLPQKYEKDGSFHDAVCYHITRAEYYAQNR